MWRSAAALLACCAVCTPAAHAMSVGVGIADVTGPPAEIGFMGYAKLEQTGTGIHLRQFARAFIFVDEEAEETNTHNARLVYVSVDAGMMGNGVRREVINKLKKRYNNLYREDNVILSGTHTHSAPGGFLMNFLFDLPILGFVKETFTAYVNGIYRSIVMAHNRIQLVQMFYGETEVLNVNINRSPTAYLRNPIEERARYTYDVDKTLTQVKFVSVANQTLIGAINWFAVHPTSMNNTNRLISSDNVGYASILMEKALNRIGTPPGKGPIVCAFASSNLGDVSPNTKGPRCEFSGDICDQEKLLCKGHNEQCFASGPGKDMFESTKIIATRLFEAAMKILNTPGKDFTGPVRVIHQYVSMPNETLPFYYDPVSEKFVRSPNLRTGCLPAMGYSFAAGTTDGPGAFDFKQGTTTSNPLWNAVRDFIAQPTEEDVACQAPKPILLATGRATFPYEWQPSIVSCSVSQLGALMLAAVPGEFSTMAGRRLRTVVREVSNNRKVVIAGLSNVYSDYITTAEEYAAQRYEGASTIFGPHTLDIYLKKYSELAVALADNRQLPPGPSPPDFRDELITLVPPVLWDGAPWKKEFGDCVTQPHDEYSVGDVVVASFVAGHPRNGVRAGRWFAAVERLDSEDDDSWTTHATDADWETKFIWRRGSKILGTSYADIEWEIPVGTLSGTYRLHHYGNYKYILGGIYQYHGFSKSFYVS